MKLVRLEIRRLPGIDMPFTLGEAELGPGLTVIHGPNGSGKSSLVRAVRAVLWPSLVPSEGLEIEAQFRERDTRWFVRRDGSLVNWTRNGEASAAPDLPSVDLARSSSSIWTIPSSPPCRSASARCRSSSPRSSARFCSCSWAPWISRVSLLALSSSPLRTRALCSCQR